MAHTPPKLRPTSPATDHDSRRRWIGLGLLVIVFIIGGIFFDIYGQGIYGSDDPAPTATVSAEAASPAAD